MTTTVKYCIEQYNSVVLYGIVQYKIDEIVMTTTVKITTMMKMKMIMIIMMMMMMISSSKHVDRAKSVHTWETH